MSNEAKKSIIAQQLALEELVDQTFLQMEKR
jgi:hypothetical protein